MIEQHPAEQALKDIAAFIGTNHFDYAQNFNIDMCVSKIKNEIIKLSRFELYNMTNSMRPLLKEDPVHFTGDIRSVIRSEPLLK